jgi:protein-S-isoprenylcysteine O-methyltransferase Ste14
VNGNRATEKEQEKATTKAVVLKGLVLLVASLVILGAILFGSAGRLDWVMAWVFIGVLMACVVVNIAVLVRINPDVIQERMSRPRDVKRWDVVLSSILGVFVMAALPLAGLDERFGWSPSIAPALRVAGVGLVVIGDLLFLWTMAVNKFCSKLVCIQKERGHYVVTTGPYRYVRHPGYVGWSMLVAGMPLILGSLWTFVPVGLAICLTVVRTVLEDKTLKEELDGYENYARRVRYKLVPGVW